MTHPRKRSDLAEARRAVSAIYQSLVTEAKGLAATLDPLDAELRASAVLSLWHADDPREREAREALGVEVLQQLAMRPESDVLALFTAIAALAAPPLDEVARASVETLRGANVQGPPWASVVGRPVLVEAWISTDEWEDQSFVVSVFAHERRPPHALVTIMDANFDGLARDASVALDPAKVRREWIRASGLPISRLSEQTLADVLGRAIEMYDLYLDPPVTDETHKIMPLLRSRLRLLPEARLIERTEVPEAIRAELMAAFATNQGKDLGEAGPGPAADVARWFVDFACDYGAGDPLRWSPIAVEILLADWLPRKAILQPAEARVLPEVLRRWIRFAAQRKRLRDSLITETLEAVDRFAPDFLEGIADETRAGPAKQITMELLAAGVDLGDEAAVQRWINARNARPAGGNGPDRRVRGSARRRRNLRRR